MASVDDLVTARVEPAIAVHEHGHEHEHEHEHTVIINADGVVVDDWAVVVRGL